ncbi:hypothetical protein KY345_04525 [Candidatus Woesearchaeota archaeon]|nr:hypothetical protein [Candidatus Woesearchaeota archaeon]
MKKLIYFIFILLFLSSFSYAQDEVDIYMFYAVGCPYCAKMEAFLDELLKNETEVTLQKYEINQNIGLFFELAEKYDLDVGESVRVPVLFMHEKVFVGFNEEIGQQIKEYLPRCVELCTLAHEGSDVTHTIGTGDIVEPESKLKKLTLPAVISAAAVDAINPCAFAVLILLLSTIVLHKSKKKALFAGLAFTLAIFISYLLMGIGLYSAIKISGLTRIFYIIVAALAILVGLFNLKDYLWYGRWFIMEVPRSWRPKMKMLIQSVVSVPGAFLIGFAVSLFLLPCTSGPYIVILGLLAQATTRNYAFMLLVLYNFIFILPMLIITFAIYFGFTTTEQAEQWRTKKLKVLHLIAGVIILLLGIGMFVAIGLGYV